MSAESREAKPHPKCHLECCIEPEGVCHKRGIKQNLRSEVYQLAERLRSLQCSDSPESDYEEPAEETWADHASLDDVCLCTGLQAGRRNPNAKVVRPGLAREAEPPLVQGLENTAKLDNSGVETKTNHCQPTYPSHWDYIEARKPTEDVR